MGGGNSGETARLGGDCSLPPFELTLGLGRGAQRSGLRSEVCRTACKGGRTRGEKERGVSLLVRMYDAG